MLNIKGVEFCWEARDMSLPIFSYTELFLATILIKKCNYICKPLLLSFWTLFIKKTTLFRVQGQVFET